MNLVYYIAPLKITFLHVISNYYRYKYMVYMYLFKKNPPQTNFQYLHDVLLRVYIGFLSVRSFCCLHPDSLSFSQNFKVMSACYILTEFLFFRCQKKREWIIISIMSRQARVPTVTIYLYNSKDYTAFFLDNAFNYCSMSLQRCVPLGSKCHPLNVNRDFQTLISRFLCFIYRFN